MVCYCDCDFVCDLTYECVWIGLSGLPALGVWFLGCWLVSFGLLGLLWVNVGCVLVF